MSSKILVLDIETAPETAYIWKRFKETVGQTQIKEPSYVLCMAWCWLGEEVQTIQLYNNRAWNRGDRRNDFQIIKKAHELLDEADIVVGHNVKSFDLGTLNSRFLHYGMLPPSPYKVCDTLLALKHKFHLPSNSLETSSHYFNIETKEKQSFALWRDCLNGVESAWKKMVSYCAHDVTVVQALYLKLRPWMENHPNVALNNEVNLLNTCPKCGSTKLQKRGISVTSNCKYQRYQCQDCGGWARSRFSIKGGNKGVLNNAVVI
jgi:predicted RNA-binding Zn-ribbon protein involved in translation (DUF1610 family)